MTELGQQIAVWGLIVVATIFVIYTSISAWRALSRGECSSCPGCGGEKKKTPATEPKGTQFIPADQLRARIRSRR